MNGRSDSWSNTSVLFRGIFSMETPPPEWDFLAKRLNTTSVFYSVGVVKR